jgi:Repeat of unknown function (DUF5648)
MAFDKNYDYYTLYTTSSDERRRLLDGESGYGRFTSEGITCFVYASQIAGALDAVPLIALKITATNHWYTTIFQSGSVGEIIARDYMTTVLNDNMTTVINKNTPEGVAGNVFAAHGPGRVPLYKMTHSLGPPSYRTVSIFTCQKRSADFSAGYYDQGPIGLVYDPSSGPAADRVALREFARLDNTDFIYTTEPISTPDGYGPERLVCYLPKPVPERVPLYRMAAGGVNKPRSTDHFLTTSASECVIASKFPSDYQYRLIDIAGFVYTQPGPGLVPVHRLVGDNHLTPDNNHVYALSTEERDRYVNLYGYKYEGIGFYAPQAQAPDTVPLFRLRMGNPLRSAIQPLKSRPFSKLTTPLLGLDPKTHTGDFSRSPSDALFESLGKSFSGAALFTTGRSKCIGVHIEKGAPLLDRDLNLLGDLIATTAQRAYEAHFGDGAVSSDGTVAGGNGFAIEAVAPYNPGGPENEGDFTIGAGTLLIGGLLLDNPVPLRFKQQVAPTGQLPVYPLQQKAHLAEDDGVFADIVYLDAWVAEEDDALAPPPGDPDDPGMRTSVRLKPHWVVRVALQWTAEPQRGHVYYPLALIVRSRTIAVLPDQIVDLRDRPLNLINLTQRVTLLEQRLTPTVGEIHRKGNIISFLLGDMGSGPVTVTIGGVLAPVGQIGPSYVVQIPESVPESPAPPVVITGDRGTVNTTLPAAT